MLTFNGKKFNADDFSKSLTDGVVQIVKPEMGERFRSICHPKTTYQATHNNLFIFPAIDYT